MIVTPCNLKQWVYENKEEAKKLKAKKFMQAKIKEQTEFIEIPQTIGGKLAIAMMEKCLKFVRKLSTHFGPDLHEYF